MGFLSRSDGLGVKKVGVTFIDSTKRAGKRGGKRGHGEKERLCLGWFIAILFFAEKKRSVEIEEKALRNKKNPRLTFSSLFFLHFASSQVRLPSTPKQL